MQDGIQAWDWHYRVGFDVILRDTVLEIAKQVKNKSVRNQILEHLELFSGIISIDALIEAIKKSPENAERFITEATQKRLLYCPAFARAESWPSASSELQGVSFACFEKLGLLIEESSGSRFTNLNNEYFSAVFTESGFRSLVDYGLSFLKNQQHSGAGPFRDGTKKPCSINERLEQHLRGIQNTAQDFYPSSLRVADLRYEVEISKSIDCWAEYWPRQLTGEGNKLIIGEDLLSSADELLASTLVHEIVGHACFYQLVEKGELQLVDQGAHCLVEGWATWCEWNCRYLDIGLRKRLKADACSQLSYILEEDPKKITREIEGFCSLKGYSSSITFSSIRSFYQYPCLAHSYVVGALGIEHIANYRSLEDLWSSLGSEQAGNHLLI